MPPPGPPPAGLPAGWEEKTDPASGKKYYVNRERKVTQWERPGSLPPWEEKTDPASGRKYYVNHLTKQVQWDRPT